MHLSSSTQITIAWTEALVTEQKEDDSNSWANLTLSCDNGAIPIHPFLLMGASIKVRELLNNEDISQPSFIHFHGYKLKTLSQMVELLYFGKTSSVSFKDQAPLFSLLTLLEVNLQGIMCKRVIPEPAPVKSKRGFQPKNPVPPKITTTEPVLRVILKSVIDDQDDENEDQEEEDKENVLKRRHSSSDRERRKSGTNEASVVVPSGTSQLKRPSRKMKEAQKRNWKFECKCLICHRKFTSEQYMMKHLYSSCSPVNRDRYDYVRKYCLVCNQTNIATNIWEFLGHAEACMGPGSKVDLGDYRKRFSSLSTAKSSTSKRDDDDDQEEGEEEEEEVESGEDDEDDDDSIDENEEVETKKVEPEKPKRSIKRDTDSDDSEVEKKLVRSKRKRKENDENKVEEIENEQPTELRTRRSFLRQAPKRKRPQSGHSFVPTKRKKTSDSVSAAVTKTKRKYRKLVPSSPIKTPKIKEKLTPDSVNLENKRHKNGEETENSKRLSSLLESTENVPSFDPDIIVRQLNIQSPSDTSSLSESQLQKLFQQCPICKTATNPPKINGLALCLRSHDLTCCWTCLKLFQLKGFAFDAHVMVEHASKVKSGDRLCRCPFCVEPQYFEYKTMLPLHIGNVHGEKLPLDSENNPENGTLKTPLSPPKCPSPSPSSDSKSESGSVGNNGMRFVKQAFKNGKMYDIYKNHNDKMIAIPFRKQKDS